MSKVDSERHRYFGDWTNITDVFQNYENLVEFFISSGHLPPIYALPDIPPLLLLELFGCREEHSACKTYFCKMKILVFCEPI